MGFESMNNAAPQELLEYEKWWGETYGREVTPEEDKQLLGFAQELAKKDEEFKQILGECLVDELIGSAQGLEDPNRRRWTMVSALSTYGKKFNLKVD